ncbi:MAG: ABC transporter ATP-binding protein [Bacteroidales bacterium]|nr:ABC transporter ATP-binding protein [Bacteroidales bacterium]
MISVQNLSKSYTGHTALDRISLEVKKGELFGLIGPDGAGKTTLIRILTTLLLPDSGEVRMSRFDAVKDYKEIRKIVGYMPGRFSLYQDLSVIENLEFFATVFGTTIQENYHLIKDIYSHIEPFKNRLAGKLSGGMKQKLALSCALIHQPEILILDEPTTGVDAVSRKEFWEMLKNLQKMGITILVSTPYMDEAVLCDRVALMQEGKFLDIDTPDGIINKHQKKVFAISAADKFHLISELRKFEKADTVFAFGQYIHLTAKDNQLEAIQILDFLKSKGFEDATAEVIKPGIEDVFMSLMKNQPSHA